MKRFYNWFMVLLLASGITTSSWAEMTELPPAPSRSSPGNFSSRADAFVAALPGFVTEANLLELNVVAKEASAVAAEAEATNQAGLAADSAAIALASANYKGAWSAMTGAANVPYAVSHNGQYWQLTSNLADVTVKEPGVDSEWILIAPISTYYYPDYLAADHGVTGASNTIKHYVDLIGATNKATIYLRHNSGLDHTDYTFSTNETIPSNITLRFERGARLAIATGVTVTINSPFNAGLQQVFSCTGTGKVVFGPGSIKEVYSEWWGKSATNDSPYIQAAVNSLPTGTIYGGGTIVLSQTYVIDTQITVGGYLVQGNIIFKGSFGHAGYPAQIKSGTTIGTTPLFYITGIGITFDGVLIQGDGVLVGGTGATTVAIKVGDGNDQATNPDEFKFINGGIIFCETAIELNSRNFYIRDNIFAQVLNPIKIPGLEGSGPYNYEDRRDYFIQRNNFHVSNGTCISLTGTKSHAEVWVTDNHFKQVTNGFYGAVESSSISDNNFDIIKGKAIEVPLNSYYTNVRGVLVSNNIITGYQAAGGNTGDAISIRGGSYIFPTITGNKINRKAGNGIVVQASHAVISNNTVSKCYYTGIDATGSYISITDNIVIDNDHQDTNTYSGIKLSGNYGLIDGNLTGNTASPAVGGAQIYGVHIATGSQGVRVGIGQGANNKLAFMLDEGTGTYGFVGDGIARRLTTGLAAPVAGTWAVGDYIINRAPSVAGGVGSRYIIHGWHCTVAGTPGTWVEVRTLTGT